MENQNPFSSHTLYPPKPKSNLSKIFIERKTHNPPFKNTSPSNPPDKIDNLPLLQFQRQNPITFLHNIQSSHNLIQKNIDQSFMTSSKWRSYNTPLQTPQNSHSQKQNILFQTLYTKRKQLSAIRVYNHVNNDREIPTKNFEEPQFLQFIQQAVSQSTRKTHFLTANNTPKKNSGSNTQRNSKMKRLVDIKHNYTIGDHRKQLQNLQKWIKTKLQTFEEEQKSGQSLFTDRINFMNMAFCEVSRVAGTFSTETKHLIDYLYKKYYDYYNLLTECMIEQNKKIKAEISTIEDRLLNTINYYEEKLAKSKKENQEKSQKIVVNFQKCIQMKTKLQKSNKQIKINLTNEQKKSKLVQQALIKVITLFLALGQKNIHEMTFSLQSQNNQYIQTSMLAKSKKHILSEQELQVQKRKIIFQEWCGYLIKMIHRILVKEVCQKQGIDVRTAIFKKQAFEVIKQYMTENDESISPADAENILNKFLSTEQQEYRIRKNLEKASVSQKEEIELAQLQKMNKKFEDMYSNVVYELPSFEQVYNKLNVNDFEVQVNMKKDTQNSAVQTLTNTEQVGIMVVPRMKSRQVDVSSWLRQKLNIQSNTVSFYDVFKVSKQESEHQKQKKIKMKKNAMNLEQNKNRLRLNQTIGSSEKLQIYHRSNNGIISFNNLSLNGHDVQLKAKQNNNHTLKSLNTINEGLLIDVENCHLDDRFKQIGVNTIISRSNNNKNVQFKIANFSDEQENQFNITQLQPNEQHHYEIKSNSSIKNSFKNLNTFTSLIDQIKETGEQSMIKNCQFRKRTPMRKNGFLITGNAEKNHLSQKFIPSSQSLSEMSEPSIESDLEDDNPILIQKTSFTTRSNEKRRTNFSQKTQQNSLPQRQQKKHLLNKDLNLRSSLQNSLNKPFSKKKPKKNQNIQERVIMNRSYFNLSNVQYATKKDAEANRIKKYVNRGSKKKNLRQKHAIDPHDFHIELAFKNSQKIKFLTSITLWPPKLMLEMKKIRQRVKGIKPFIDIDNKKMNLIKGYVANIVNPLLKDSLKSYCQLMKNEKYDFGEMSQSTGIKIFKGSNMAKLVQTSTTPSNEPNSSTNQLSYHQRLSPLLYNIINYTQYHLNRTSSDNESFFSGLKALKQKNSRLQVYYLLIEGRCVELDIFVRTVYQFNLFISGNSNYNPEINYFVLESGLIETLQGYFTGPEIQKIVLEVKRFILFGHENPTQRKSIFKNQIRRHSVKSNLPIKLQPNSKICYYQLLLIIFKNLREKQKNQSKKYSIIKDVISRNSQCTAYEDIMHFLRCLPIQNDKSKKILSDCLKHVVYWSSNQASVPNDILYFILDKYELYNSSTNNSQNPDVIKQYIINRCELYFKTTLHKVIKNPEWVLNSTYILSYKIPKIFHRVCYQIRMARESKQKKILNCFLTLIFCNLIDIEMEKRYMPALLNGLIAVPLS